MIFGDLKVGDLIGEQGVVNQTRAPWTIEVTSKTARVYRIQRAEFMQYFGGANGAPARYLQNVIQMKKCWDQMKYERIKCLTTTQFFENLTFRNEDEFQPLTKKATLKLVQEQSRSE